MKTREQLFAPTGVTHRNRFSQPSTYQCRRLDRWRYQKHICVGFESRVVSFNNSSKQRIERSAMHHGSTDKKSSSHLQCEVISTSLVVPTEDHALSFRHYFLSDNFWFHHRYFHLYWQKETCVPAFNSHASLLVIAPAAGGRQATACHGISCTYMVTSLPSPLAGFVSTSCRKVARTGKLMHVIRSRGSRADWPLLLYSRVNRFNGRWRRASRGCPTQCRRRRWPGRRWQCR